MRKTKHPKGSLERLYSDHRRMSFVYGTAIIILAIVFTSMIWLVPSFQVTFSWKSTAQAEVIPPSPVLHKK